MFGYDKIERSPEQQERINKLAASVGALSDDHIASFGHDVYTTAADWADFVGRFFECMQDDDRMEVNWLMRRLYKFGHAEITREYLTIQGYTPAQQERWID